MAQTTSLPSELPESENDKKHLKPDEATLDLPDVENIPGQEHIKPPIIGEMADTTISSEDEEGDELFREEDPDFPGRVAVPGDPARAEREAEKDIEADPDLQDTGLKGEDLDEGELARLDNSDDDPPSE